MYFKKYRSRSGAQGIVTDLIFHSSIRRLTRVHYTAINTIYFYEDLIWYIYIYVCTLYDLLTENCHCV